MKTLTALIARVIAHELETGFTPKMLPVTFEEMCLIKSQATGAFTLRQSPNGDGSVYLNGIKLVEFNQS